MKTPRQWWKSFFDPAFYTPAGPAQLERASAEARFVLRTLGLKRGASVLDLCCGPGRHSLPLARAGLRVTGLDFSVPYLLEARAKARKLGLDVRFVHGDMRSIPFKSEFDAVLNLFTSFGYFPTIGDDLRVLRAVARALKPGGLFLLDIVDRAWIERNAHPKDWHELEDGGFLLEERRLSDGCRKGKNRWVRVFPDGKVLERSFVLRQYDRREISSLLGKAGLRPLKAWGSFEGARQSASTNRVIILSRKPV